MFGTSAPSSLRSPLGEIWTPGWEGPCSPVEQWSLGKDANRHRWIWHMFWKVWKKQTPQPSQQPRHCQGPGWTSKETQPSVYVTWPQEAGWAKVFPEASRPWLDVWYVATVNALDKLCTEQLTSCWLETPPFLFAKCLSPTGLSEIWSLAVSF